MDRGAGWATVHGVAESWTQLKDSMHAHSIYIVFGCKELDTTEQLHFHFQFSLVSQLFPILCDPKECSILGFPAHHQLPEL